MSVLEIESGVMRGVSCVTRESHINHSLSVVLISICNGFVASECYGIRFRTGLKLAGIDTNG